MRGFAILDWVVLLAYLTGMVLVGVRFARRQKSLAEFFLASRSVPVWAASLAIVATSVSAVTFLGAPEDAYRNNLTYLSLNLAALIAVLVVAVVFIPAFYRHHAATIYQLIGDRLGPGAQKATSAAFMGGRLLASGARLYVAAIPTSLLLFGNLEPTNLYVSILLTTLIATAYTMCGGIHAVIWTEVPQALLFFAAAVAALVLLWMRIDLPAAEVLSALRDANAADGSSKLTLIDTRWDPMLAFSLPSALLGFTLFNMAVYGADHDLAQRMLTCKSAVRGAWSAILSNIIGFVVALLFLAIGLLLFLYYQRPDLVHNAPAAPPDDSRQIFLHFILTEIPPGLRGLMIAGVVAAAMSSLASSLSAMSSTLVCDFYKPLRPNRPDAAYVRASRAAVLLWSVLLGAVACFCVAWQQSSDESLLQFAIGVMIFAYAGLLAVFLTALLTKRGSAWSAGAALIIGALVVAALKFPNTFHLPESVLGVPLRLSSGYQMLVATVIAFLVCILGRRAPRASAPGGGARA
ncbi:MAG: sodium:solute symporter [Phycisphaerales bacterium]